MSGVYDYSLKLANGSLQSLSAYRGDVLLIVNVASRCGFTPQYQQLQEYFLKYQTQGFNILAFPCNQFKGQEPESIDTIQCFVHERFNATFPLFDKIDVNGEHEAPLYTYLKQHAPGFCGSQRVKWNFTKFLVDREGHVIKRFAPFQINQHLAKQIEKLLDSK